MPKAPRLGSLQTDDGRTIEFDEEACRGFSPEVGLRVVITLIWERAARELLLAATNQIKQEAEHLRDVAIEYAGEPSGHSYFVCQALTWVAIDLKEPPPRSPPELATWARRLGLAKHGVRVAPGGRMALRIGKRDVAIAVGDGPFEPPSPHDDLDEVELSAARGFLALSLGPRYAPLRARLVGEPINPWSADGDLTVLSRVVAALVPHATRVTVPTADAWTAAEADEILRESQAAKSPPRQLWFAAGIEQSDQSFEVRGLQLFGLPDILVELEPSCGGDLELAEQVAERVLQKMLEQDRPLRDRDYVEVRRPGGPTLSFWAQHDVRMYGGTTDRPFNSFALIMRRSAR